MKSDSIQGAGSAFKVMLANDRLSRSGIPWTVELSGASGTGIFSDLGGQPEEQVNSLVLEVLSQELRIVNLKLYLTTYMRRSKVTVSS